MRRISVRRLKQPIMNIGTAGHVDHGKSTLTQAITGIWPERHSEELKKGITIRLGYADATIRRCPSCPTPQAYTTSKKCPYCGSETEERRKISIVDCPGHETLMATMLAGATIMDAALLVIAANEKCPQPQTREHLAALQIMGVDKIIVVQNKIELVDDKRALENFHEIKEFVKGTIAEKAPIIPMSALHKGNLDILLMMLVEKIPEVQRDTKATPRMYVARSFDVNRPGTTVDKLIGGVIGGTIIQGKFSVGDEIECRPGVRRNGKYMPLRTKIVSLRCGNEELDEAVAGGLVAVGTELDPALTKSDALMGNVVGPPGTLPEVLDELTIETHLMSKVVGLPNEVSVEKPKLGEIWALNVGTAMTAGKIVKIRGNEIQLKLLLPVCAEEGQRIAISRKIAGKWRLIGYGIVS